MADAELTLERRFELLFERLGLERAHVASGYVVDVLGLVRAVPGRVESITLVSPARFFAEPLRAFENRLLFISGDRGPGAGTVPSLLGGLPQARSLRLAGGGGGGRGGDRPGPRGG